MEKFSGISEWFKVVEKIPNKKLLVIEIEEMSKEFEEVKKIIKEYFNKAPHGLFFCRNTINDAMTNIYDKNGIQVDICYNHQYFEVFGLDLYQQLELEKFYDTLER